MADDDFEERVLYKPTIKSVDGAPAGDKPAAKKKQSSSHNQVSSAKLHIHADPVPDKESTLVSNVK